MLSSCGLFGGDDAAAQASVTETRTVRVNSSDRFFDIDPSSLFTEDGELAPAAMDELAERVANLSLGTAEPTNAGIIFDGSQFVVNPSIPGSTPDLEGLAAALSDQELTTVDIALVPISAEVDDDDAEAFAAQLNDNLAEGIDVRVDGVGNVLDATILGEATTVELLDGDWVVSVDYDGIADELNSIFDEVATPGGEATFSVVPGESNDDRSTVEIVPGEPAMVCCGEESVSRIVRALTGEANVANLQLAEADGERGVAWAEELGIDELVGTFTTRYTAGQDRNINIQRISELTQGMIIEPGETWSLNEEVGQRTRENGFVPAGTIVNGHLTDSVGGGISQYATTIFNAAFFAGLEYDEYQAHSIYFSRYPYGREATISWPAPQLEIYNPTPYGILIWPTTTSNSITVDLYSTKWADVEQTGQSESTVQVACTRVTTERTRTFLDGATDVDSVFAIYRQEGIGCDGEPTQDPDAPPTTTTTTTIAEEDPENLDPDGQDPENPNNPNNPTAPTPSNPDDADPQPADPPAQPNPQPNPQPPADGGDSPANPNNPPADPEQPPADADPPAEPDPTPAADPPAPAEQPETDPIDPQDAP